MADNDDLEFVYGKEFFFRKRRGKLDLRRLSQLDLDSVIKNVDIEVLQNYLENVVFSNLTEDDFRFMTDPLVVKLFKVSQLMIEYLLFAQEQLAANLNAVANKYVDKKRTIAEKRKKIAELREVTNHLKMQVRMKKKNIETLEDVIKKHKPEKSRRRHEHRGAMLQEANQQQEATTLTPQPTSIAFFVVAPDGACYEFNENPNAFVQHILSKVERFISSNGGMSIGENSHMQLIYQGRNILTHTTLAECNIRKGDTIVAVVARNTEASIAAAAAAAAARGGELQQANKEISAALQQHSQTEQKMLYDYELRMAEMKELMLLQKQALSDTGHEIRRGMEQLSRGLLIHQQPVPHELATTLPETTLVERMSQLERNMRQQLDAQFEYYERQLKEAKGRKLLVGDLESDDDDESVNLSKRSKSKALDEKIKKLEHDLSGATAVITDLRESLLRQAADVSELRNRPLSSVPMAGPPLTASEPTAAAPTPKKHVAFSKRVTQEPEAINETTTVALAPAAAPALVVPSTLEQQQPLIPTTAAMQETVSAPAFTVEEETTPSNVIIPKTNPDFSGGAEVVDVDTRLFFSFTSNPDLERVFSTREPERTGVSGVATSPETSLPQLSQVFEVVPGEGVYLTVSTSLELDDLLFEIRRRVAEEASVPLSHVSLNLLGRVVQLAIDFDDDVLKTYTTAPISPSALSASSADTDVSTTDVRRVSPALALARDVAAGNMTIRIPIGTPVSDAQVDAIVAQWESHLRLSDQTKGISDVSSLDKGDSIGDDVSRSRKQQQKATTGSGKRVKSKNYRHRRSWDDLEDEKLLDSMDEAYSDLDNVLSGLSESEGLTDDELKVKTQSLKKGTEALPGTLSEHMRRYRTSIASAISSSIDSDVADFFDEGQALEQNGDSGLMRRSAISLSLSLSQRPTDSLTLAVGGIADIPSNSDDNFLRTSLSSNRPRRDFGEVSSPSFAVLDEKHNDDDGLDDSRRADELEATFPSHTDIYPDYDLGGNKSSSLNLLEDKGDSAAAAHRTSRLATPASAAIAHPPIETRADGKGSVSLISVHAADNEYMQAKHAESLDGQQAVALVRTARVRAEAASDMRTDERTADAPAAHNNPITSNTTTASSSHFAVAKDEEANNLLSRPSATAEAKEKERSVGAKDISGGAKADPPTTTGGTAASLGRGNRTDGVEATSTHRFESKDVSVDSVDLDASSVRSIELGSGGGPGNDESQNVSNNFIDLDRTDDSEDFVVAGVPVNVSPPRPGQGRSTHSSWMPSWNSRKRLAMTKETTSPQQMEENEQNDEEQQREEGKRGGGSNHHSEPRAFMSEVDDMQEFSPRSLGSTTSTAHQKRSSSTGGSSRGDGNMGASGGGAESMASTMRSVNTTDDNSLVLSDTSDVWP